MSEHDDFPAMISSARVAKIFGKTTATIRLWLNEGKFPNAKRLNGRWLIPEADVEALVRTMVG